MRLTACAIAIALLLVPAKVRADCNTPITSACINSDTLWPHAGPSDFIGVGGSETVQSNRISFGLVASYESRPIILHSISPGTEGSDRNVVDNQFDVTFLFAYGLTDRFELDLALPVTVFQDGDGTSPLTGGASLGSTATRDLRFGATYTFLKRPRKHPWRHDARGFGLAARFEITAPTGDQDAFASEPTAVYVPSLALDYRIHRFFFAAEIGARIRPTTDFAGARIGTQGIFSVGAGADLLRQHDWLSVMGEIRLLPTFSEQGTLSQSTTGLQSTSNGTFITPAEWMISARTSPLEGGDLSFQLGVGGGLPTAYDSAQNRFFFPITSPRFRTALSLTFAPRGRDTDGDEIVDSIDHCPLEPGPKTSSDGSGCPEKLQPE